MLLKLSFILIFSLVSFVISRVVYPRYIQLLRTYKAGQNIRTTTGTGDDATIFRALHQHKAGTPTMGGAMFLLIMGIMVLISIILQNFDIINNTLRNRNETYILLFAFFGLGWLGLVDDAVNIIWKTKIQWLSMHLKLVRMFGFSAFISWWFFGKLGVMYINLWPIAWLINLWRFYPILTFFFTIAIVNAINITDGLDGLVGGMSLIVLWVLGVVTFVTKRYLVTAIVGILIGCIMAFLWFNINPAKIFMGDAWALGMWWLIAVLVYMINIRFGIFVPFMILFALFWLEFASSGLQLFWKKVLGKKLFPIAPFHHLLEHRGYSETHIVMKFWLLQGALGILSLALILYQWYSV
jgi:phospho-N-acetylmuramoyl-pentapeptide-transferase